MIMSPAPNIQLTGRRALPGAVLVPILITLFAGGIPAAAAPGTLPKIQHQPARPKSGDVVRITADFRGQPPPGELVLQYQIVDPGNYVALSDAQFQKLWL